MKAISILRRLCIFTFSAVLLVTLVSCGNNSSNEKEEEAVKESIEPEQQEDPVIEEPKESEEPDIEVLYDKDESINLYLNKYNEIHTEAPITGDMFSTYYHHGSDHDDQIVTESEKVKVVITGAGKYSKRKKVKVVIGVDDCTEDECKQIYIDYALPVNSSLTTERLVDYWAATMEDVVHSLKFDEFELRIYEAFDEIETIEINGELQ